MTIISMFFYILIIIGIISRNCIEEERKEKVVAPYMCMFICWNYITDGYQFGRYKPHISLVRTLCFRPVLSLSGSVGLFGFILIKVDYVIKTCVYSPLIDVILLLAWWQRSGL